MARTTVESNRYPAGRVPTARALTNTDQGGGALPAKLLEYCWNRFGSS